MSPRSCSGGPKTVPRAARSAPRAARSAPRGAQEQPGAHQKGPKRGPGRPRSAKRPFGRPPGPILASFWGALGFIFKQLRRPFRSSRALRQTIENTLRNHWSKGLLSVWPAFGGRKRNHDEGVHAFSGQDVLLYESNWPPRRVFSHVGPQKPLVFTWFRAFHAFLRPPVAPRGQKSNENALRNHLSKGPSRQLRDRSAQGPWLGGRVLGRMPHWRYKSDRGYYKNDRR